MAAEAAVPTEVGIEKVMVKQHVVDVVIEIWEQLEQAVETAEAVHLEVVALRILVRQVDMLEVMEHITLINHIQH